MPTISDVIEILEIVRLLKQKLIKAQDYENGALIRDMEKQYLDKKTK